jgi:hypothetical protein
MFVALGVPPGVPAMALPCAAGVPLGCEAVTGVAGALAALVVGREIVAVAAAGAPDAAATDAGVPVATAGEDADVGTAVDELREQALIAAAAVAAAIARKRRRGSVARGMEIAGMMDDSFHHRQRCEI